MGTDYFVFVMCLLMGFGLEGFMETTNRRSTESIMSENDANFHELNRKFSCGKRKCKRWLCGAIEIERFIDYTFCRDG